MKTLVVNRKYFMFIVVILLIGFGTQGSYGQTITASTPQPLTEATLHESVVTLTLNGGTYERSSFTIATAITVSGIDGVTFEAWDVDRISDTEVTVELTFDGDLDTNATLTFTVSAEAIAGYDGQALAAQVPVTAMQESLVASTESPLTEATLHGSIITLTLSGRWFADEWYIGNAVSLSGIDGVTFEWWGVERISDTEATVELTFDGDFDTDATLTFTVGAEAIVGYNEVLTAQVSVTAMQESLVASTEFALTEANLHGSIITFTLSGRRFADEWYGNAVSLSGINGVTVGTYDVERISDTEATVELTFEGDFDTDAILTFTVSADAIAGYNKAFTFQFPVTAVEESLDASTASPLTETTLHGSVVTLTLSGRSYAYRGSVSVSGIDGVAIRVNRVSDTEITAALTFSGNLDTDTTLTFTVSAEAIAGYNEALTAQVPVTAIEESLVPSTVSPLTETTLHGSVVTLTLSGGTYEQYGFQIADALTISGIDGVTFERWDVERISDTEATVELTFDGDFDTDATLTFTVGAEAIAGYSEALTAQVPVTAIEESLVPSTEFSLTEANLHGSVVTFTLSGRVYEEYSFEIADALTISGIDGVTFERWDVERISDTEATVELTFDGDFDTDATLTFTVGAEAIAGYNEALTAQIPVPAIEQSNATVSVSPSPMLVPAISEQFTLSLNITNGENIAGYQATVSYDDSALRYVESANGDYLPANAFFTPPIVKSDWTGATSFGDPIFDRNITLAANTLAGVGNGDGTLATLTFEVIDFKPSTLTFSQVYLVDADGKRWEVTTESGAVTIPPEPAEPISGDINRDGVVNPQDLVIVNARFGQRGQNSADLNGDGIVNIMDLVLVAGAFGGQAAAPSAQSQELLTASNVRQWLFQAQQLALMDPTYLRGVTVLEQLLTALSPKETVLLANYPNPFNPETWIPYHLSNDADVHISIYDTKGVLVRRLDLGHQMAGYYTDRTKAAYWNGRNESGESVASGLYFYQLCAGDYTALRRMAIVK